jgi:16S rRNA (uracil1498-N3)-methyltransferase
MTPTARAQRLFVDGELAAGAAIACSPAQSNYLRNVLRLSAGSEVLVFNGRDGEWRAKLGPAGKRGCVLELIARVRFQQQGPDLDYVFAPLKRARLDYMVQKATEMGVARLRPVVTRHTVAERIKLDRMRANVVEAAEQCGILRLPLISEPVRLQRLLETWSAARPLIFCDEEAPVESPLEVLSRVPRGPLGVLLGPEGGFDAGERSLLLAQSWTVRISLGPRVLRADTAAVAVLALVNAVLGDWRAECPG